MINLNELTGFICNCNIHLTMKQVSVISDLCVDFLVKGNVTPRFGQAEQLVDDYDIELGGSAAIFASQFARLGGSVSLYGLVGEDLFGQFLLRRLEETGVISRVGIREDIRTSVGLGLIRGQDRAMLTYDGSMRAMDPKLLFTREFFESTGHLHICSYFLLEQFQDHWPDVIRELKSREASVSLDTNWSPAGDWERALDILPLIDVFLPNEQEAVHISNESGVDDAGEWLALHGPLVIVKRGELGASVYSQTGKTHHSIPNELTDGLVIKDTTGAGDNFDAGFLYAWLNSRNIGDCVNAGMRCGTSSLNKIGGIAGQAAQITV